MNRKESSRLGELQAEGNLGNERNRNSARSGGERMRNRSSEGRMRERSRESEERESSDEWTSGTDIHDDNDGRRGGER